MSQSAQVELAHEQPFEIGRLAVDPGTLTVRAPSGAERKLEPRAMQVLVALASAEGAIVSRSDLRERCWSGRSVGDDAIDRAIALVRRLGEQIGEGGLTLETIPRVGYRLHAAAPAGGAPAAPPQEQPQPRPDRRLVIASTSVAALGLLGGGLALGGTRLGLTRPKNPEGPLTVAVLPFDSLSPDPSSAHVARGLAREIRNTLSRVGGLRLIADSSSFAVAAQKLDHATIGRRLGASLLLQGSVSRAGSTLRIGVELVDPASGALLWTSVHEDASGNLFRLQDRVAASAIQEIAGRIGPEAIGTRPASRRRDPVAFRRAIEAQQLAEESRALRMTGKEEEALDAAGRSFALVTEALAIDRQDVGALLTLATLTRNGWTRAMAAQPLTPQQRASAAVAHVRAALVADPNDPAALAALGDHYRRYEWRWHEAENLLRRALAADPSLGDAHWSYAYMLGTQGRALEGLAHARILFRLDPETAWRRLALPRLLYASGDRSGALAHYDRELALAPDNLFLIRELYFMHLAERDATALRRLVGKLGEAWRGRVMPPGVQALIRRAEAGAEALGGRPAPLAAIVDEDVVAFDAPRTGGAATRQGRASVDFLYIYAMEYAAAGRVSRSLDLLERALAARSLYWPPTLPYGPTEFPEAVRRHPRYAALWAGEPRLKQLVDTRLRAVRSAQMAGVLPDGRRVQRVT